MKHMQNLKNGVYLPNIFHRVRNEQANARFALRFESYWRSTNSNTLLTIVEELKDLRIRPIDYVDVEI